MEWRSAVAGAALFLGAALVVWWLIVVLGCIVDNRIIKLVKRPALEDEPFVFRLRPGHEYITREEVKEMMGSSVQSRGGRKKDNLK